MCCSVSVIQPPDGVITCTDCTPLLAQGLLGWVQAVVKNMDELLLLPGATFGDGEKIFTAVKQSSHMSLIGLSPCSGCRQCFFIFFIFFIHRLYIKDQHSYHEVTHW